MSWTLVADKDFEDSVQSRMVWAIIGVFSAVMLIGGVASSADGSLSDASGMVVMFTSLGGQIMVPLVSLAVGYKAIVEERESGGIRVLFGLGHGRRDIFIGKLTSRLAITAIAMVATSLFAIAMALLLFDEFSGRMMIAFLGITILYGMAYTGIGIGISAVATSRMKALAGMLGTYVFFSMFWYPLIAGVHYVVRGKIAGYEAHEWYFFLLRLSPLEAYIQTISSLTDNFIWQAIGWQNTVENIPAEAKAQGLLLGDRIGTPLPFYLSDWFAPVIMTFWIVVPAVIGYWRFSSTDLN